VQHYLAHPEEARRIAERGRQAVLDRHRVDQRVERMLRVAGLSADQSE
jgi:spore maturation protein CgeB